MDEFDAAYAALCEAQAWLNELLDQDAPDAAQVREARANVMRCRTRYNRAIVDDGSDNLDD